MRYVAAYLLAVLGGKASPLTSDIEKILTSVGVEIDPENLKLVLECLKGKSIDDLIAEGKKQLCSMAVGVGAAPAAASTVGSAAPTEEKKEEKKATKEESESEDEDMGFGLFD